MKLHQIDTHRLRRLVVAALALAALAIPATAGAGAEHIVMTIVDAPAFCGIRRSVQGHRGSADRGEESGVVHITELGDRGHHVRGRLNGTVDARRRQ